MKVQRKYFEEEISVNTKMLTQYPPPQSDFGYPQQVLPSIDDVEAQSWFSNFLQPSPEGEDSMLTLRSESQQPIQIPDWLSAPVNDSDRSLSDSSLLNLACTDQDGVLSQPRTPLPMTDIPADELRLISAVLTNTKEALSSEVSLLNQQKLKLPIIENGKNESMKLPGFHQAFGSTEIGRFSQHEEFFEPPQEDETCIAMHEANDLLTKVSPVPPSAPTTSKRGRGGRGGGRRAKTAGERKYNKANANNQINAAPDPSNESCKVLPAASGTSKMEMKKEWDVNGRDSETSKLNHLQNRAMHEQSSYSSPNGFLPPSPYFNQTGRQERYSSMHHNSYYNPHYCSSRYSKDLANPSQDRFVMSNSGAELFRHPSSSFTAHNHFQSSSVENSSLQGQTYQSMGSQQCWNHQFGMFGSALPSSNSHQSYSGMMSSYVSPTCDSLHSSSNEYKNYYYNSYSSSCTDFDSYQTNYNSSNYHFQQRSHPYRRMGYQSQPTLPTFNNDRLHYN